MFVRVTGSSGNAVGRGVSAPQNQKPQGAAFSKKINSSARGKLIVSYCYFFFYINTSSVAPSVLECLDCFQRGPTYNCVAVLYDAVCNYQPQTWKLKKLKIIVIFTSYWGFLNWAKTLMLWSHVAFNVFLMLQINFM